MTKADQLDRIIEALHEVVRALDDQTALIRNEHERVRRFELDQARTAATLARREVKRDRGEDSEEHPRAAYERDRS